MINTNKIRRIVQIFFFVLIAFISISHTLVEKGIVIPLISDASLHALCPFGGIVSIYQYFVSGTYVQKIHESSFVLMWITFVLAIGFGPVICGWVCPLGSIQEWFGKIGRKIFKRSFNNFIPYKYDRYLRYTRYFVLAWVVYMTAVTGKLVFADVDPYSALFSLWSDEIAIGGIIVLAVTLTASLFVERPWCKYACPYGALLGISNFIRIFKIRRNSDTCVACNKCSKECPMNIPVSEKGIVRDHQCISCLKCTSEAVCPVAGTIEYKASIGSKQLIVKMGVMAIVILATVFGGIGISSAMNMWATDSEKVPATIQTGEFTGEYDPADIRGSYSFKDIENAFNVPVNVLAEAYGVQGYEDLDNFQLKNLESIYGELADLGTEIGTDSVKVFVGLYTGLPIELDETFLPKPAVDILLEKGGLTDEQKVFIELHSLDISNIELSEEAAEEEYAEEEMHVSGKTTFAEVIEWGISKEKIEEIIGDEMPALSMTVADYCRKNEVSFSTVKDALNDLLENK